MICGIGVGLAEAGNNACTALLAIQGGSKHASAKTRNDIILEISKKIYEMEWVDETGKSEYWRNLIAWNVQKMGETVDMPQAESPNAM